VRRHGYLFEKVCGFEPLARAAMQAALAKRRKPTVARFLRDLEAEVLRLERELIDRSYRPRPYRTFVISDPKQRMICAADFRDRVVHHAACAVLALIIERTFIADSFACRNGKGSHAAVLRAQRFLKRFPFFLKLDVRKFFDSVDHGVLKALLRKKIKDPDFLWLLEVFIDHPVPWTQPGKGLPIGNLTSQHFANFYLDPLDHCIKDQLGVKGYVRYMDDLVIFGTDKHRLWQILEHVEQFLNHNLMLRIKPGTVVLGPSAEGMGFLGFRIFPGLVRLPQKSWRRFRRKLLAREADFLQGRIEEGALTRSVCSLTGHVKHAASRNLLANFFDNRFTMEV